ncbi:hypothetical protein GQ55_2G014300 [Panicum hallii var. hallii]|uniref:Uncharacterized protein n=1 Tax=Panicum hallii var. hallii TaxID=1504633 RepID=A0A2T7EKD0_9POAL|nr:hypothetical protein GQ55_2G014300 [Panicum hallii var. hallii]
MSSVSGSWWSAVLAERTRPRGRAAILHAIGSVPAASSAAAQAPPRHASSEDGVSPAASAAGPGNSGPENAAAGDAAAGASPGLSAETALAILADCFGHC